jgi:hypothetical protein
LICRAPTGNTGWKPARIAAAQAGGYPAEFDLPTYFLHDVPADVAAAGEAHNFPEADIAFGQPCAIEQWPDVRTRVLAGRDDRLFPLEFQRQTARDRLGLGTDVIGARLPDLDPEGNDVHRAKDVTVAADGAVYFNVGSSSNASPDDRTMSPQLAVIMAVSPDGTDLRVVPRWRLVRK